LKSDLPRKIFVNTPITLGSILREAGMRKSFSDVCFELARCAANKDYELLAYVLRLAAAEASQVTG
jgi:hypothetical protein